jgi:hypothetical protein
VDGWHSDGRHDQGDHRVSVKPRKQHEAIQHGNELPMDRLVSLGHHAPFHTRTRRLIARVNAHPGWLR